MMCNKLTSCPTPSNCAIYVLVPFFALTRNLFYTTMLQSRHLPKSIARHGHRYLSTAGSAVVTSPTLLARSRRQVELAQDAASEQLGDIMAKRWLGNAASAVGPDTDRVSSPTSRHTCCRLGSLLSPCAFD